MDPQVAARTATWTLNCDSHGLLDARRHVADALSGWGLAMIGFEAELLVSELFTNAIVHACCPDAVVRMACTTSGVRVEVEDARRDRVPSLVPRDAATVGGLGLHLVAAAAPRWGCDVHEHGKVVFFELDYPHPSFRPRG